MSAAAIPVSASPADDGLPLGRDVAEGLLHNMSAPPKSVIRFEGLENLAEHRVSGGSGVTGIGYRGYKTFGLAVRFALPADWKELPLRELVLRVDPECRSRTRKHQEARILARIEEEARHLPLPDGCLVVPAKDSHLPAKAEACTVLAVLAKCTETVWLRDKAPSLTTALSRGAVSLLVPPEFAKDPGFPVKKWPRSRRRRKQS